MDLLFGATGPVIGDSTLRAYANASLNSALALSSEIFLRSSGLSHSVFSIIGLTLSVERLLAGSTEELAPGQSAPKRQRSTPTVLISRRSAQIL